MRSDPNLRGLSREVNEQSLGSISLCRKICIMLCFDENQDYQDSRVSLPPVGQFTTLQNWDPTRILTMPIDTVPYSTSTIQYYTVPPISYS